MSLNALIVAAILIAYKNRKKVKKYFAATAELYWI